MPPRLCSEWGINPLGCERWLPAGARADRKTCSKRCRDRRSRRLKQEAIDGRRDNAPSPENAAAQEAHPAAKEINDARHRSGGREVSPALRNTRKELQRLTNDAAKLPELREAARDVYALALLEGAKSIATLAEIRDSGETEKARLDAAKVLAGFVPPAAIKESDGAPTTFTVVNTLGQPGGGFVVLGGQHDDESAQQEVLNVAAEELFTCEICEQELPITDREGNSSRCHNCQNTMRKRVTERFAVELQGSSPGGKEGAE